MLAVDKRDEATLLPLIKRWIEPGTIIISDCWKAYCNLEKHGYTYRTVNHSQEFVKEQGDSTNKMEGHSQGEIRCFRNSEMLRKPDGSKFRYVSAGRLRRETCKMKMEALSRVSAALPLT